MIDSAQMGDGSGNSSRRYNWRGIARTGVCCPESGSAVDPLLDASPPMIYRFGIFEVDTAAAELRRKGLLIRIQDQPIRLLIALLEARGQIVSKEQVRSHLWAQDVHVEVDGALSVAIAKLREALGDDAANPRFVETVPRRGYRFIAPIETESPELPVAPVPVSSVINQRPKEGIHGLSRLAISSSVAVLLAAGAFAAYRWMRSKPHDPVHSLIVTDFNNTTGDAVFDGSLRRAAIVQLAQSPWLSIESDTAVDNALQSLNRPPSQGRVTPEMARQTCQPLQADAILSGVISRRGTDNYLIALESHRCGDGKLLSRASSEVKGRDGVLGTMGQMLAGIRHDLGESAAMMERFNTPLEQATTDSLEALNAYRVGYDLRSKGHSQDSIPYFKAAILLDPRFAMAYEQLGSAYTNMGEEKTGAGLMQKAFDLRERATEPERYVISGRYFDLVAVELEKALTIYSLWHTTYPRDWSPLNAMSNDLNLIGRYPEAIGAAQEAVRLEPNHAFPYTNLALGLLGANRFAEAEQVCADAAAKHRTTSVLRRVSFQLAFASGDSERIRKATDGMKGPVDDSYWLAEAAIAQGKVKEAEELFTASAAQAHNAGLPGIESSDLTGEAIFLALVGEKGKARRLARSSISDDAGEVGYGQAMVVLALLGDEQEVSDLERKMDHNYPVSTYNIGVYRPMTAGLMTRRHGGTADKILEVMAPAVPYQLGQYAELLPIYIRAISLADAGDAQAARQEFQHLLDNRGVDPTSPLLPLSHLGLARVHKMARQTNESCIEYREFLREWKNADPAVPILRAARSEAARSCTAIQ
jgi:DNA-binding winged helix-turn-helix (wHTH) protein/tetratricopeptide (TPR) repeat protein